jgi:hypothetical protein
MAMFRAATTGDSHGNGSRHVWNRRNAQGSTIRGEHDGDLHHARDRLSGALRGAEAPTPHGVRRGAIQGP